jgi:general secretion pathway protein A
VKRKTNQSDAIFQVRTYEELGLAHKPFTLAPDPAFHYSSRSHTEAMGQILTFLHHNGGLALVFGDVGTGKTILSRCIIERVNPAEFDTCLIFNPLMTVADFFGEIFQKFHVATGESTSVQEMEHVFRTHLKEQAKKERKLLLVIDEAQMLPDEMLSFLEDFVLKAKKGPGSNLYIILFAQLEIMSRFMNPHMKFIRSATSLTCYIHPLGSDEVESYIMHRLTKAGSEGSIRFTREAIRLLYEASSGCPRVLNTLCDQSILLLCDTQKRTIDEKMVKKVLPDNGFAKRKK